jgi:hypothetical protein
MCVFCRILVNSLSDQNPLRLLTRKLIWAFSSVCDSPSIIGESMIVLGHSVHGWSFALDGKTNCAC